MAMQFPHLERVMLDSGFDKEVTANALAWLDITKERDMALLEKLTVQDSKAALGVEKYMRGYREAFQQDVIPHDSEELYSRVILMSYQLLNVEAYHLTWRLPEEIHGIDRVAFTKHTMQEVWGDAAQALLFAAYYVYRTERFGIQDASLPTEPGAYLRAAEQTSDKYYDIKLMLCANALTYMPLPDGEALPEDAQRAVSMIRSLMQSGIRADDAALLTALATASCFDAQLKAHFHQYAAAKSGDIYKQAERCLKNPARALDALFSVGLALTQDVLWYILRLRAEESDRNIWLNRNKSKRENKINLDRAEKMLQSAAKFQPEAFKMLMLQQRNVTDMAEMNAALKAVKPDAVMSEDEFRDISKRKTADAVASCFQEPDKIQAYLRGDIAFDKVWKLVKSTKLDYHAPMTCKYIQFFGEDAFILRCIAVLGGCVGRHDSHLEELTGYGTDNIPGIADSLLSVGLTIVQTLDICGNMMGIYNPYSVDDQYVASFSGHTDEIAAADISKCNADAKTIALTLFKNDENKFRRQIMSLAEESAKSVQELISEIVLKHPDWSEDIRALLQSKKSSARDFALTLIERQGAKAYIPALQQALTAEKTDKLKARIGSMLTVVSGEDSAAERASAEDIVKDMTKGKKTAKLDWLFQKPFSPVRKKDGTEADESWLKALMLCFANSVGLKDPNADSIAAALEPEDVCRLANEALERWLTTRPAEKSEWMEYFLQSGLAYSKTVYAQAKYKWVLYFASVYGGKRAHELFDELMAHWPLMQKGGLAKEIPHAILLSGSSECIMKVEKMSRKHRFNSIRKASADALLCASEKLGISKEEFAESMPKPGKSDDSAKAEAAYKEFTAMKKLMKTVVAAQLVRLENTMRTGRTWTTENWKKLFVANPILHRFAIGLIWGIYQGDALETSFRYLDDGSFTDVDDAELTLPDNALIGLVHPVELYAETLAAWKQQLKDYDILQPFAQLGRGIFKPTDEEQNKNCIERFKGQVIKSVDLAGAMNKVGWSKGAAGDGAMIDDFLREDVFERKDGIRAVLTHSGMSVEVFRGDVVDVTIDKLYFYRLPDGERMTVKELRNRYFSEILYQLSKVFEC